MIKYHIWFFKLNAYYENKYFDENYQENNITNRHGLRSHVEVILLRLFVSAGHKQSSLHYQLFHYLAIIIRTLTISNGNILKLLTNLQKPTYGLIFFAIMSFPFYFYTICSFIFWGPILFNRKLNESTNVCTKWKYKCLI